MKTMTKVLLPVVLAGSALSANVFAENAHQKSQCESQVASMYGDAAEMKFVAERRFPDGTKMQYSVHSEDPQTGYTTSKLAVCWLAKENYQAYTGENTETVVADVDVKRVIATEQR